MKVINWDLIGHPMNWLVISLMLFVGGLILSQIDAYFETRN